MAPVKYLLNEAIHPMYPPYFEGLAAYRRQSLEREDAVEILDAHGIQHKYRDVLIELSRTLLGLSDIRDTYLRTDLSESEAKKWIKRQGYEDIDVDNLFNLFYKIPSISESIISHFRGTTTEGELKIIAEKNGIPEDFLNILVTANRRMIDIADVKSIYYRTGKSESWLNDNLSKLGFSDDTIKDVKEILPYFPQVPDLIRFAVREVYSPDIVSKYGQLEDLPSKFLEEAKKTVTHEQITYSWEIENYPAEEYEPYAPPVYERSPHLLVSPTEFTFEAYGGSMNSWEEYGKFIYNLNYGRDNLPVETKELVRNLTSDLESDIEKAIVLYEYLQENTRYVSIQIGIGGIQPFSAEVVDENGYGDCKALTNYMKSLLKEAGIESYYSLIRARPRQYRMDTSFVSSPFNHAILYLPLEKDTLWLECTSQTLPFGFLGDFTDDRFSLVITEEGGKLVKTRKYGIHDNIRRTKASVEIYPDGDGQAQVSTIYRGLEYDKIIGLLNADYERQKDYLYHKHIDIPDFKIRSFKYEEDRSVNPSASEYFDLELINYASKSGSRLFIPLNLMNCQEDIPRKDSRRINPIRIDREYIHYDTIEYIIPEGYIIEHMPTGDTIDYDFGYLAYSVSQADDKVLYLRRFEQYRNEYPKEKYDDYIEFCRKIFQVLLYFANEFVILIDGKLTK
ncbi:hypothetical protein ES705_37925 [subsurface metagenome]